MSLESSEPHQENIGTISLFFGTKGQSPKFMKNSTFGK